MPILTAAFFFLLQSDSGAAPAAPPAGIAGFSALADLMGNIGPVAICVLVVLLIASLYSWTVILGKASAFKKATKESKRFIRAFRKASQLKEIAALANECPASPLAQVFEDVYETYKRQTGGTGPPRNIVRAGTDGADGGERGRDQPGAADDVAGDDCFEQPVCGFVRDGDGRGGRVPRAGDGGIGNAAGGCAGHCRGADYDGGGIVCGRAGGGGVQPACRRGSGSLPRRSTIFAGSC